MKKILKNSKRGVDNQYRYMLNLSRVKDNWFQSNSENAIINFYYISRIRDKEDNNN